MTLTNEELQEINKIKKYTYKIKMDFELSLDDFDKLSKLLQKYDLQPNCCIAKLSEPTIQ